MKVRVRDGASEGVFEFEPKRHKWQHQNSEFIRCYETGLKEEAFEKVFIKRIRGKPATAHDLLRKLEGRTLAGTAKVLGFVRDRRDYIYIFEYLPPTRCSLLEDELTTKGVNIIRPRIVQEIVNQVAHTFEAIGREKYVYSAKNIMLDHGNRRIVLIDLDSAWPIARLKKDIPDTEGQIEFWGVWEDIRELMRDKVESAPKTVVLSFAAVWSRAIALVHHPIRPNYVAALKLAHNPNFDEQSMLWDALKNKKRQGFLEFFSLDAHSGSAVYSQWQYMLDGLRSGRELPWQAVISATDNLLSAIERAEKSRGKPSQRRHPVGAQARQPVSHNDTVAGPMPRYGQAQPTGPPVTGVGVPKPFFVRYRTGLVLASGLVVALIVRGAVREHSQDTVPTGAAERCIITAGAASGQTTGTLYYEKNANRARADFYTTDGGIKQGDHFIMYPGMMYAWQDDGKVGIAVDLIGDADPKKMFNSSTEVKCDSWVPTNTPFILPDGIMYRHVNKEEAVHYFESRNLIKE